MRRYPALPEEFTAPLNSERPLKFSEYAAVAKDCDLALYKPTSFFGRTIATYTGGPFSHVTGILHWNDVHTWMSAGYEERKGGIVEPLKSMVQQYPGVVCVYRVIPDVLCNDLRKKIKQALVRNLGWRYRWSAIRMLALTYLPFVRLFTSRRWFEDRVRKTSQGLREGICSMHVARSFGNNDILFIRKPYSVTTPNDVARSTICEYIGTLYPDDEEQQPVAEGFTKVAKPITLPSIFGV